MKDAVSKVYIWRDWSQDERDKARFMLRRKSTGEVARYMGMPLSLVEQLKAQAPKPDADKLPSVPEPRYHEGQDEQVRWAKAARYQDADFVNALKRAGMAR